MLKDQTVLYLGRFQPFHLGHLQVLLKLKKEYAKVVVGLCSCQKHHTKRNPFTFWERYEMITRTLSNYYKDLGGFEIIPIPDIECPEKWSQFVHAIFKEYDLVITNNPNTRKLFESIGDKVESIPEQYCLVVDNLLVPHSTLIRDSLAEGIDGGTWMLMVPRPVVLYLLDLKAEDRLRQIYKENP